MATSQLNRLLGAISVLLVTVVITALYPSEVMVPEPPILLLILNTLFVSIASFLAALLSAKGFMMSGAASLLLLGSGQLMLGSAALVSGWVVNFPNGSNPSVTVYNVGVFLVSAIHLVAACLTSDAASGRLHRLPGKSRLMIAYLGVLGFVIMLTLMSFQGTLPPFFVQGVGPTSLRQGVLVATIVIFFISSLIFMKTYFKSRTSLLYWYSLALTLIALGLLAIFIKTYVGSPLGWVGRTAQYLGGIYLLIAVITAIRGERVENRVPADKSSIL